MSLLQIKVNGKVRSHQMGVILFIIIIIIIIIITIISFFYQFELLFLNSFLFFY